MRKNGDFVFLRPVLRLGIGMMAALCERTISFTFDESGRRSEGQVIDLFP